MRQSSAGDPVAAPAPARACCGLCGAKDFLLLLCAFLICVDLVNLYGCVILATGNTDLPWWGNATALHLANVPTLTTYDSVVLVMDVAFLTLVSLAVCSDSLEGLVCSLCGFATAVLLELVYLLWLVVAVVESAVQQRLSARAVLYLCLWTVVPEAVLLLVRLYGLSRLQSFRKTLRRGASEWRRLGEQSKLIP